MRVSGRTLSRRHWLLTLAIGGAGAMGYARFVEPRWLDVTTHTIPIPRAQTGRPLRLLHLSDLHASRLVSLRYMERAIMRGLRFRPDLVCLTGDFIVDRYDQFDRYAEILSALPDAAPTFACLGNHDGGRWARAAGGYASTAEVRSLLRKSRVTLLHNAATAIEVAGWKLNLVGLGDLWADELEPEAAFAEVDPGADRTTVVLCHNPDAKDALLRFRWDLLLSGHAHGGQFAMPLLGAPFAPVSDKRFVKGLHRWNQRWVHVTKGVGNVYGLRFNCRPEICLLTLL